jgi:PAS domain S-box-containing protein
VDFTLAVALATNLLHARRYRNYNTNIYLGITFSAVFFVYVFLTGGINSTGFVCYYIFPMITSFVLGSKKGAIANGLISLPVVILLLIKTPSSFITNYSFDFKLRFLFSFLVISVFSYLFEYSREQSQEELRNARSNLEKQVEERTSALQEAIQSLQAEMSERYRVEQALRESEGKYRTILEDTQVGYFELDLAGNVTFVNDEACRRFGYPREELIGMNYRQYYADPEEAKQISQVYNELYRTGKPIRGLDREVTRKDGTKFVHELSISLIRDSEGKPIGFRGTSRDITQRKKMEEALRTSEAQLSNALKIAHLGHWEYDVASDLFTFSDHFYAIFRTTSEREGGYTMSSAQYAQRFVHPDDRSVVSAEIQEAIATTDPYYSRQLEHKMIYVDGEVGYIAVRFFVIKDDNGRTVKTYGVNQDITDRKRAEEALRVKTEELARSNRELEQFAYVASHDLQEPLRMVTSYVQLLARRYKGKLDSDADEFIAFAENGAIRMWRLINDLLTYSRVGAWGKEFEPIDCETVLNQSLDNLKVAIEENGAVVTHDPLPIVMADHPQLVQLFQNLIGNAIKFRGNEPPRIHVSASRNGNGWTFSVCDNGIGIAPEYAKRIFVIFQRLHSREKYPGTGIGLAICQKIVERHGGRIWVESEVEKGATFYFTLPASKTEQVFS